MDKTLSLKLNKEFKRAYFAGKYKAHPLLVSYCVKNHRKSARIGITTSKKIGGAVQRNRARRVIRQAFFEISKENEFNLSGYDFVFVARTKTAEAKSYEVKKVMKKELNAILKA